MELVKKRLNYFPIGLAIFSMFFGAGNSIFPLLIGTQAGSKNIFAMGGLSLTALVIPMLGLFGMILYNGDYKAFFYRLGKTPGFFLISLIMIVIGPFAGIPRCITLSFATLKPHLGSMPLMMFSSCACILVFVKTIKKSRLIAILGKVLTPLLLTCLAVIIIKGIFGPKNIVAVEGSGLSYFSKGLTTGYQMMDLLASFFFATTVVTCLKANNESYTSTSATKVDPLILKSIFLSACLLGVIYLGFSYVGAFNSVSFQHVSKDTLLAAVGIKVLGSQIGVLMGIAFALACLTTVITLVSIFADFIHQEFFNQKIPYWICVTLTLLTALFFSNLGFDGICMMINPLLNICYPALILLTVLNIVYKLYDFKPVKAPVFILFFVSLLINWFA